MSVYTDLLKVGVSEETATSIAAAVARPQPVSEDYLDRRLAELELRLTQAFHTSLINTMLVTTAIFAIFVAVMTGILAWIVGLPRP